MDEKKLNHKVYKKLKTEKARLWSFSEVSSYVDCPHSYYLARILKVDRRDNIYSKAGTLCHDIIESVYENNDTDNLVDKFKNGMIDIYTQGYNFMSRKIQEGYIKNISLYFENFVPDWNIKECEIYVAMPLWIYDGELIDNYFNGWIDAVIYNDDGTISIGDFKTSTIYEGEELMKKSKQLILYAIAYEFMYHKKIKSIFFDFLKYGKVKDNKGKERIMERKEIETNNKFSYVDKAYVFVELNDNIKREAIKWFVDNIKNIKDDNTFNKSDDKGQKNFFCKKICGVSMSCPYILTK